MTTSPLSKEDSHSTRKTVKFRLPLLELELTTFSQVSTTQKLLPSKLDSLMKRELLQNNKPVEKSQSQKLLSSKKVKPLQSRNSLLTREPPNRLPSRRQSTQLLQKLKRLRQPPTRRLDWKQKLKPQPRPPRLREQESKRFLLKLMHRKLKLLKAQEETEESSKDLPLKKLLSSEQI